MDAPYVFVYCVEQGKQELKDRDTRICPKDSPDVEISFATIRRYFQDRDFGNIENRHDESAVQSKPAKQELGTEGSEPIFNCGVVMTLINLLGSDGLALFSVKLVEITPIGRKVVINNRAISLLRWGLGFSDIHTWKGLYRVPAHRTPRDVMNITEGIHVDDIPIHR